MMMPTPALAVALVMLIALTVYALFGGADFGAGVLDLLARGPRGAAQRALIARSIGPVWEVNHIWLILVVVLFFSAFPPAFASVLTTMHVPLSIMLVGIVLRGSAFTFRAYDLGPRGPGRWNHAFSVPSVLTPFFLGMVVGSIAMGRAAEHPTDLSRYYVLWISPFSAAVGLMTICLFSYLASVYLTLETSDRDLQDDFRRRALGFGLALAPIAWGVYLLARAEAPIVFRGLSTGPYGFPIRVATGIAALAALLALLSRRFAIARAAVVIQAVLILWGCALTQSPYLAPPTWTVANAAAPAPTLRLLLAALGVGSLILLPSLFALFRVFKRHALAADGTDGPAIDH